MKTIFYFHYLLQLITKTLYKLKSFINFRFFKSQTDPQF